MDLSNIEANLDALAGCIPDRRERIATAALSGLLAWSPGKARQFKPAEAVELAVEMADALIAELDGN